ncbi:MAG: Crp/Fnr family transcriptional regulator [Acidobacteriota bacterium]|nr:Crp/Fnr family transcriptional regulator [Acidobacteriota bacterium]
MPDRDDTTARLAWLARVPLFQGLGPDALVRVADLAHPAGRAAGAYFFQEGEQADEFFMLTDGRVRLTQVTPDGHQIVLRLAGPGDVFGGVGTFGYPTYHVSAEAVTPSRALAWTSPRMRELLEAEPGVALNALHFVAGQLYDLQQRHRELMTERVERRIARAVLRLVQDAGRRVDAGIAIDFPVSRQDLAELTGTTLYTVSRCLSSWEERGIVRSGRQRIVLVQPESLLAIAEDLPPPSLRSLRPRNDP